MYLVLPWLGEATIASRFGSRIGNDHMRLDTPSRFMTDSRTEKESKLTSFVSDGLVDSESDRLITLVARGTDSPVAAALAAVLLNAKSQTIATVRVVLFDIDSVVEDHAVSSILDIAGAEFRVLPDSRFAAAHEQLVIGSSRAWLGDCMRRDPSKRDAFEIFHDHNATAIAHATGSFTKLWASAKPLKRSVNRTMAPQALVAGQSATDSPPDHRSRRG